MLNIWLALAIDHFFGDPPNNYHPVAWIGLAINWIEKKFLPRKSSSALLAGLAVWISLGSLVAGIAWIVERTCHLLPFPLNALAEAFFLKLTLSKRGLTDAAEEVAKALEKDLPEARRLLAWHLVSRDTHELSSSQVAAATIESVAENTSDGILAPLIYYVIGGLPFAWLYRFANTLDSMWGYHDLVHEWLGKAAARLDDFLNFIPARFTALLLIFSAWLLGENAPQAIRSVHQDARTTTSPNAGYPMSAMAGALSVELEKVDYYQLGKGLNKPERSDIQRAIQIMTTAVMLGGLLLGGLSLIKNKVHCHKNR